MRLLSLMSQAKNHILQVERLDIGALVSIRGAGRVKISRFLGVRMQNKKLIILLNIAM